MQSGALGAPAVRQSQTPPRARAELPPPWLGAALAADDIKANGQIHPIMLDKDGRIGDGRNRYAACRWLGIEPRCITLPADTDWFARVVEKNLNRRHATVGARAVALVKAAVSQGNTTRGLARMAGLSPATIGRARFLVEHAPDLAAQVVAGASLRAAGLGADAMNEAAEIKLRAERRAGAALAEMALNKGGPQARNHVTDSPAASVTERPPRLADIGITPKQSKQWQDEAAVPDAEFEAIVTEAKESGKPLTSKAIARRGREHKQRPDPWVRYSQSQRCQKGTHRRSYPGATLAGINCVLWKECDHGRLANWRVIPCRIDSRITCPGARAADPPARGAPFGQATVNHATRLRVDAERKAGALLEDMDRHRGGRPGNPCTGDTGFQEPRLADLGVTRRQASDWGAMARMPDHSAHQLLHRIAPLALRQRWHRSPRRVCVGVDASSAALRTAHPRCGFRNRLHHRLRDPSLTNVSSVSSGAFIPVLDIVH